MSNTRQTAPRVHENTIIAVSCLGMFLSTLDSGIINVALPSLQRIFHTSVTTIAWTVTLYMMTLSSTIILFGRLSDRHGKVKIAALGLIVFGVGSLLCGAAPSALILILARGVQGLGAAMLQATAAALITTLISQERRHGALGTLGMILGLGPVLGPAIGGFLLSGGGWRWMFWINLPLCVLGLWLCRRLTGVAEQRRVVALDGGGNILFALSILALLMGLSALPNGLYNPQSVLPLGASLALFTWFLLRERKIAAPLVKPEHFHNPAFAVPFLATLALGAATTVAFVVPPYFLEGIRHLPPWRVGLVSLSSPLGIVLLAKASGAMIPRFGKRRLMIAGGILMLSALLALSTMRADWQPWLIALFLLAYGAGYGIALPSILASVMDAVSDEEQGAVGAAHRMNQNVGIAVGAAASAVLIQTHLSLGTDGLIAAFRDAWLFGAIAILLFVAGLIWQTPAKYLHTVPSAGCNRNEQNS